MTSRLIIEGNSVYEIDEDCEKSRKEAMKAEKNRRIPKKGGKGEARTVPTKKASR